MFTGVPLRQDAFKARARSRFFMDLMDRNGRVYSSSIPVHFGPLGPFWSNSVLEPPSPKGEGFLFQRSPYEAAPQAFCTVIPTARK